MSAITAVAALAAPVAASAAFADEEARNYSKIRERYVHETSRPAFQSKLLAQNARDTVEVPQILAADPERNFLGNLCAHHKDGCAGDVRLHDWQAAGHGIVEPVLWTARSGATISGDVWATRAGPASRPGVVITTGSVQAPEELYLYAATTLAKKGYVVLTYDVQGQGRSDTFGEAPDQREGVPAQQPANFVEGAQAALDFFLSTPADPYVPRPSTSSGTSHRPKHDRRVAVGLNAAHNPLHALLDRDTIGLAGHSLGAFAISQVGSDDPRVDAIVAWDNLSTGGGQVSGQQVPPIPPRVPALGMSADYGLTPQPYTAPPDPQARNAASNAFSAAGVDTAQINIRGGTHYEFSFIPNPAFGATLRGMDATAWYTGAWFDKYLKGDASADRRLLTTRWHDDPRSRAIDPGRDGNLFSRYLRSRIDVGLAGGGRARCEDLRSGCAALAAECTLAPYSYLAEATTADGGAAPPSATGCTTSPPAPPSGGTARLAVR